MPDHQTPCEAALLSGQWDVAETEARAWARHLPEGKEKDPRPHFALNAVHLIRGQFADAWQAHSRCLSEADDIAEVKQWVESFVGRQQENAHAHLIMGLFLAQSGESELSMKSYKEAAKLAPESAYPHYFLAQIHERANHLEMAIKEYREAVRLAPKDARLLLDDFEVTE